MFPKLKEDIFDDNNILEMYFQDNITIVNNEEKKLEELLSSFESESEELISLKIGIMKKIKKEHKEKNKYEIFNLANSYINKYFYNLITYQDKDLMSLIN